MSKFFKTAQYDGLYTNIAKPLGKFIENNDPTNNAPRIGTLGYNNFITNKYVLSTIFNDANIYSAQNKGIIYNPDTDKNKTILSGVDPINDKDAHTKFMGNFDHA